MALRTDANDVHTDDRIKQFTQADARAMFDRMAQFTLAITGDEFLKRWNAGDYRDRLDEPSIDTMVRLMRVVQRN